MTDDLQALADANMRAAFERLAPYAPSPNAGTATFGDVVAVVTGVPSAFFNPVIAVGRRVESADVRRGVAWVRERGIEPCVAVRQDLDPSIAMMARELGLEPDAWRMPGMVLDHIPAPVPAAPPELELLTVRTPENLEAWYGAVGESMRTLITAGFAFDPDARLVVGLTEGRPVCASIAFASPGAMGIYAVGTREEARGHGYGTAVTWGAIDAGRDAWGERPVVLQSSEMGDRVYRAMGFREICRYVIYAPPVPAPA